MKLILPIIAISLSLTSIQLLGYYFIPPIPIGEQLVNEILGKGANNIQSDYSLSPCGSGAAMPGGPIQELTLCFETTKPYKKEQLRTLLVSSAHKLLRLVTENNEIQQYLKTAPFTIKNVEIIIYNSDTDRNEVHYPGICVARISQGTLIFRTSEWKDGTKHRNKSEETYEEALKIIENEKLVIKPEKQNLGLNGNSTSK